MPQRERVLSEFVRENGWRRGCELGLWQGRVISYLLAKHPDLFMVGVDAFTHLPDEMDHYQSWNHDANEAITRKKVAPYSERCQIVKSTTTSASDLDLGLFDFIFIDADHREEAVRKDIRHWRPKLENGGWLIGHDITWPSVRTAVAKELGNDFEVYDTSIANIWIHRT